MGSFANSLFKFMLGWLQGAVSAVWSAFTNEEGNSLFNWIGRNWLLAAGILCVAGLAADLCVYLFRWKPFKVWKSYFTRNKGTEKPEYEEKAAESPDSFRRQEIPSAAGRVPEPVRMKKAETLQIPDLSQWEKDTEQQGHTDPQPAEKPVLVTNAGYIVPEDSPYRRPSAKPATGTAAETGEGNADRNEPNPVLPRRRRRINVTELFTDPEEELRQFDAPQHVIDSRKAYRDPVYPHGWQKSEDKES